MRTIMTHKPFRLPHIYKVSSPLVKGKKGWGWQIISPTKQHQESKLIIPDMTVIGGQSRSEVRLHLLMDPLGQDVEPLLDI